MTDDHDAHAASLVRSAMHLAPTEPLTGTAQRLAALIAADRRAAVAAERKRMITFVRNFPMYDSRGCVGLQFLANSMEEVDELEALAQSMGGSFFSDRADAAQATPDAAGPAGGE